MKVIELKVDGMCIQIVDLEIRLSAKEFDKQLKWTVGRYKFWHDKTKTFQGLKQYLHDCGYKVIDQYREVAVTLSVPEGFEGIHTGDEDKTKEDGNVNTAD